MNKKNLDKIIEQYIENFTLLNSPVEAGGHDEGYKWRVISSFKEHWNIDAPNFCEMFCKATEAIGKTNLINNSRVHPLQGIVNIMTKFDEAEFVRKQFKMLYSDDDGDFDARGERANVFRENMNAKIDNYYPGTWKFLQNPFACIFYLSLNRPEENYIYRASEAHEWADCMVYGDDFGSGATFSLKKYYKMCDELREALQDYPELLELHQERFNREAKGFDDQLHLLVFDIIFCSHYMGFYNECPSLGVSSKERVKIAKRREENERLDSQAVAKQEEIDVLEKELKELPDLIGRKVTHKSFGEGIVESYENEKYTIAFKDRKTKFKEEAIAKGLLIFKDDAVKTAATSNLKIQSALKRKDAELREIVRKIENL